MVPQLKLKEKNIEKIKKTEFLQYNEDSCSAITGEEREISSHALQFADRKDN